MNEKVYVLTYVKCLVVTGSQYMLGPFSLQIVTPKMCLANL